MEKRSEIRDNHGKLIAERVVTPHRDGHRVQTQEAFVALGTVHRGRVLDDRDVYADGSEYHHKGARIR